MRTVHGRAGDRADQLRPRHVRAVRPGRVRHAECSHVPVLSAGYHIGAPAAGPAQHGRIAGCFHQIYCVPVLQYCVMVSCG